MIKFNQHAVVNTKTGKKARVQYSIGNRIDGCKCVTIYAKDYGRALSGILPAKNETDSMADYFETDTATIFEDSPLYPEALKTAQLISDKWDAKYAARMARYAALPQ